MKIQTDDQARELFIKFGTLLKTIHFYQPTTMVSDLMAQWCVLETFIFSEFPLVTFVPPEEPEHTLDTIKIS